MDRRSPEQAALKRRHLQMLEEYRHKLWREPELRDLFLELTLRCNENCIHCGSRCGERESEELSLAQYQTFLRKILRDFGAGTDAAGRPLQAGPGSAGLPRLCITGGEPMLRRDFFELMEWAHAQGFRWGMTSNATLIDRAAARRLRETGMGTISVSIDGPEATHDAIRKVPGAWRRAMRGIENLLEEGGFSHVQVTTVVNHRSIRELETLYKLLDPLDIDSWRVIGMEPIGRALDHPDLLLTPEDQRYLFDFIRDKRQADIPVLYGCSHYLGTDYEREVRDWYFLCNAGIYVAGIMANGDIGACLDIERRPETVFGNILRDDFTEVWKQGFQIFRRHPGEDNAACRACEHYAFCGGGSFHSWDYDRGEQRVCMRGILFE